MNPMNPPWYRSLAVLLLVLPALAAPPAAGAGSGLSGSPEALGQRIDSLAREGALVLTRVQADPDFPGRRHLRYAQHVDGVPVFGVQVVRQVDGGGRTLSVFGHFEEDLHAEIAPTFGAGQAARLAEAVLPRGARAVSEPELVLLPRDGRVVLTWMVHVRFDHHLERVFVDARTGDVVWRYDDLRTETAVGAGTGVWGDRKKVSADSGPDGFRARDRLRPPLLETFDLRFDLTVAGSALVTGRIDRAFVARTTDNNWRDGAVVDAHVYSGWTYDYFFKRHGRRGIDGQDLPALGVTHFLPRSLAFANAFWDPVLNAVFYGDGDASFNAFSGALDVVAHELAHGVTQYTWNGIYAGEPGALNEAFSDIMGTAVEFFHEPAGVGRQRADYFLGEDLPYTFDPPRTAVRSMADPSLFCDEEIGACDPDHYSLLYRGPIDGGGVHHNSGIANQAFYLLVEGGVNRTSGRRVAGLGATRRDHAERIFYRGFTGYLTPAATFSEARVATIQAARDLYGETEAAEVAAAWSAVGVE